jgi:hypothetical protein
MKLMILQSHTNPFLRYRKKTAIQEEEDYFTLEDPQERKRLLYEHIKGHFCSDAIYHSLRRQGIYWTGLKKKAIELVKECLNCQHFNIVKQGYNPLRPITAPIPGDSWGIDLTGPFKTSIKGNNYLLVIVDIASRFCILRPIPTKTSLTIVKELIDVFTTFGLPCVIQSDNGKEFVNEMMTLFAENADSLTSYKPQKEIIGPHIRLLRLNKDY